MGFTCDQLVLQFAVVVVPGIVFSQFVDTGIMGIGDRDMDIDLPFLRRVFAWPQGVVYAGNRVDDWYFSTAIS